MEDQRSKCEKTLYNIKDKLQNFKNLFTGKY